MASDDKHYYMQFHVGDWLKDPAVSSCSPATRGIWLDLLCAMHESDRSGRLSHKPEILARFARCSVEELLAALRELREAKVADVTFSNANVTGIVTPNVTVTNRRMRREYELRTASRVRQKRARKKHEQNAECHANVTLDVTPSSQRHPETETETDKKPTSSIAPARGGKSDALLRTLRTETLADRTLLEAWIAQAVASGVIDGSEATAINVAALAARCLRKGEKPAALFAAMFKAGKWDHIAEADFDAAAASAQSLRRKRVASRHAVQFQTTEAE